MKNIFVRAWDFETETMMYSDIEYDEFYFSFNDKGKLVGYRIVSDPGDIHTPPDWKSEEIEDDLMLFTNHLDKDGNKIYEEDIIKVDNYIGVVKYYRKEAGFFVEWKCGAQGLSSWNYGEIIGNSIENPELMK